MKTQEQEQKGINIIARAIFLLALVIAVLSIIFIALFFMEEKMCEFFVQEYFASKEDSVQCLNEVMTSHGGSLEDNADKSEISLGPPYDIGREFSHANAFYVSKKTFCESHPGLAYYEDGNSLHIATMKDILFWDADVSEATLNFKNDRLMSVDISVFNKGIEKCYVIESAAIDLVNMLKDEIFAQELKTYPVDDGMGKSATYYKWEGSYPQYEGFIGVLYGNGRRNVEYLNFKISVGEIFHLKTNIVFSQNVRYHHNGDVCIDGVPMVNQGRKGYCVPATMERLLRYYGFEVDMHLLALIMDTKPGGGTLLTHEFESLTRIAYETGLIRTDYLALEIFDADFFERYNKAARDAGKKELHIEDFTIEREEGDKIILERRYDWMCEAVDKEIAVESKFYNQDGFQKFKEGIISSIQQGYPLIWSVERLFAWEVQSEEASNGHMRLVVGYNLKTKEILYSDSWGYGHDLKRAPIIDAWIASDFLSRIAP